MKLIAFLSIYTLFIYSVYLVFNYPSSTPVHIQGEILDMDLEKNGDYLEPIAVIKQDGKITKQEITPEQYKFHKIGDHIEINRYITSNAQIVSGILIFCACIFIIIEIVIWTSEFRLSVLGQIEREFSDLLRKFKR